MKVSRLIKILQETTQPDDDICALFWTKDNFGIEEGSALETWRKVCQEFEDWDDAGMHDGDWIVDAINDNHTHEDEA